MIQFKVYIFFSIMVYHRVLNIVPCAAQQALIVYPFYIVCICSSQTPNSSLPTPLSFGNHRSFGCDTFSVGYPLQQSAFKMIQAQWFSVLLRPQEIFTSLSYQTQEGWLASKNLFSLRSNRQASECMCSAHQTSSLGHWASRVPSGKDSPSPNPVSYMPCCFWCSFHLPQGRGEQGMENALDSSSEVSN